MPLLLRLQKVNRLHAIICDDECAFSIRPDYQTEASHAAFRLLIFITNILSLPNLAQYEVLNHPSQ